MPVPVVVAAAVAVVAKAAVPLPFLLVCCLLCPPATIAAAAGVASTTITTVSSGNASCLLQSMPNTPLMSPDLEACRPVPSGHKFYLYDLEASSLCNSGRDLLQAISDADRSVVSRQAMGPDLFLWQQLQGHPARTLNPDAANLFVVPSTPTLALYGLCGQHTTREVIGKWTAEIKVSPFYQRHNGRDHLMVTASPTYWWVLKGRGAVGPGRSNMMKPKHQQYKDFRQLVRYFIFGNYIASTATVFGRTFGTGMPGQRRVVVPMLAPSVISSCSFGADTNRIECPLHISDRFRAPTFHDYYKAKKYTLFFIGDAHRKEDRDISRRLRPLVVKHIGDTKGPNILADAVESKKAFGPPCNFTSLSGPTTGCASGFISEENINHLMSSSRFALHVLGDDAGSSRIYEALDVGIPQIFLADRYYADVAAFKCKVPYERVFLWLSQDRFREDPSGCISHAIGHLEANPEKWEALWAEQMDSAKDLLWHVPGSRVGTNIIEEAMRLIIKDTSL